LEGGNIMALILGAGTATFVGVIIIMIIIMFIKVTDWYAVWDKFSGTRIRAMAILLTFVSLIIVIMEEAISYWKPYIDTPLRLRYSTKLYPKAHWRLFWILHHFLWNMKETIKWALVEHVQFYLDEIKLDRRA
jgi:Na+/H+ antiporter NhaB